MALAWGLAGLVVLGLGAPASLPGAAPLTLDGRLVEAEWARAERFVDFTYPWSTNAAPATEFRAFADAETLHFAFVVADETPVFQHDFASESTVDEEDRVEIFLTRDPGLQQYYCLEIDPLGRVHDYAARTYRDFDSGWNCPGLETAATHGPKGYTLEGQLPLATLGSLVGKPVAAGDTLRIGLFRAEFRAGQRGEHNDNWLSWVRPAGAKPDFHVPSAFTDWRIPGLAPEGPGAFRARGIVLVPEDLSVPDWPERAKRAGLNIIALHDGASPQRVVEFVRSAPGQAFRQQCQERGLHVEYELHALRELLPRSLFATQPELFRMNEKGERTADANLCVSTDRALAIVATNAIRLAEILRPTTGRYFFWGDDALGWCRCPRCRVLSDSDQALRLENHLIRTLRRKEPGAQLAHLAYANTLTAPTQTRPEPGIFLEFAPIERRYDVPYVEQTGAAAKDSLALLAENLRLFPADTAQALEYWLDVSRYSRWKRPAVRLPWTRGVLEADLAAYARLGVRHVTTFAVWIDGDYVRRFGMPPEVTEYGSATRRPR